MSSRLLFFVPPSFPLFSSRPPSTSPFPRRASGTPSGFCSRIPSFPWSKFGEVELLGQVFSPFVSSGAVFFSRHQNYWSSGTVNISTTSSSSSATSSVRAFDFGWPRIQLSPPTSSPRAGQLQFPTDSVIHVEFQFPSGLQSTVPRTISRLEETFNGSSQSMVHCFLHIDSRATILLDALIQFCWRCEPQQAPVPYTRNLKVILQFSIIFCSCSARWNSETHTWSSSTRTHISSTPWIGLLLLSSASPRGHCFSLPFHRCHFPRSNRSSYPWGPCFFMA